MEMLSPLVLVQLLTGIPNPPGYYSFVMFISVSFQLKSFQVVFDSAGVLLMSFL